MDKSVNIQARINAIAKALANGESPRVFIPKITKKYNVSRETVNKDIRNAKVAARNAQIAKEAAEADALYEHAKEAEKRRLLTRDEKREVLAKIVLGELLVDKIIVTREGIKSIKAKPDHNDIMKAIDLDARMEGDYAATKSDLTTNGKSLNTSPIVLNINEYNPDSSNSEDCETE